MDLLENLPVNLPRMRPGRAHCLLGELRELGASAEISSQPPAVEVEACHQNDRTDNRIRAYLASMAPIRGVGSYRDDIEEANRRGRSLIERLALSASGYEDPQLRLTAEQMADVLSFVTCVEPVDLKGWWKDTLNGPSHVCGFHSVLRALQASLREPPAETAEAADDVVPEALEDHLREQHTRVSELLSLLQRLDEDDDTPMCTRIAVREAEELERALDTITLSGVLKGQLVEEKAAS